MNEHRERETQETQPELETISAENSTVLFCSPAGTVGPALAFRVGLEDYEILEKVAEGGMGEVYRARQISLNRIVALKRIRGEVVTAQMRERFRTEAEAAARLDHPNIVPIYEIGEAGGAPFFSMRFVEGESLAAWGLRQDRDSSEACRNTQRNAARLVAQTAVALHHAHQHGVMHRDIKPGNILVDAQGEPYLTDFGLAKIVESEQDLTLTQTVLGTPSYMAPEQARGNSKGVTTAADIYSLGAVLYQLLTGKPPFQGSTPIETVMQVVNEEPVPPSTVLSHIDIELESICLKALEKDPGARYSSARALAEDLERWLRHEPVMARPASMTWRLRKWARRRPAVAGLASALLVLGVVGLGAVLWQWREARRNESRALDALYAADLSLAFQAFSETRFHKTEEALLRQSTFSDHRDRRQFEWYYLHNRLGNMAGDPIGKHPFSVGDIKCIPGTSQFASVAGDGVRIWDLESKRQLFFLKADRHDALAVFHDGKSLVSAGSGQTNLIIWDLLTHEPKVALHLPEPLVRSVACSPATNEVAALTLWGSVVRIHAASGAILETLPPPESWKGEPTLPGDLSYTPDGTAILVGGSKDFKVHRFNLGKGKKPVDLNIGFSVQSMAVSSDQQFLALGGWSGQAGVWDLARGNRLFLGNHQNWVTQVRLIRQGKVLVSAGSDQALRWWDWKNQRLLGEHLGRVEIWALAIAPDEKQAIVGGKDGSLWVWSLEHSAPKDYESFSTSVFDVPHYNNQQLASAPGSPRVNYATMNGTVLVWSGEPVDKAKEIVPDDGVIAVAAFPRSPRVALGTLKGAVEIWSADSLDRVYSCRNGTGIVSALRVQLDERFIHAVCRGGGIRSWRVSESGAEKTSEWLAENTKDPYQFSPDGALLAGVDAENRIVIWDLRQQRMVVRLEGHAASVSALQFTPDSRRLISASEDQVARIWRVRDWFKEGELLGLAVHGLAISPDGRRVAMASAGKQPVMLWDIDTRDQVGLLPGPGAMLKNLVFSGDGQKLFAVKDKDRMIVWSAPITKP